MAPGNPWTWLKQSISKRTVNKIVTGTVPGKKKWFHVVSQVETILVTCEMWGDLQKKRSNTKIFVHDARGAVAPTVSIEG